MPERPLGPPSPSSGRKSAADEIQVGERQQREHVSAVLGDAAIADLAIAKLAFDDTEQVLDCSCKQGFEARSRELSRFDLSAAPRLH